MHLLSTRVGYLMTSHPVSVVLPYFTRARTYTHTHTALIWFILSFVSPVVYFSSHCLMRLEEHYFLPCMLHVYTTVPLISPVFLTVFPLVPILPDVCVSKFRTNYTYWYINLTQSIKFIFRCQNRQVICFRLYNVNTIMNLGFQKMWGIPWLACLCAFVAFRFILLVPEKFYYFV
jgi:hypothetical protein